VFVCLSYAYATDFPSTRVPPYDRLPTPKPVSTNAQYAHAKRTDRQTDYSTTTEDTGTARSPDESTPMAARQRTALDDRPTAHSTGERSVDGSDGAWVRSCQRQFDPHATDRLANLVDEANLVVISAGETA